MSVIFDAYVPGNSFLHKLDPRVKLWGTMLSLLLVFWLPGLVLQCLLLASFHIVLLLAGVPVRRLLTLWRQMAVILILILILQSFFNPYGFELFTLGPLRLTLGGLHDAARLAARAIGFAFVIAVLLFTTEHHALVLAFVRLGLPYTWGLTISLALRFLPAIQDLYHAIRDAQASRGWVASGGIIKRFRGYFPILIAVIVGTLRMSEQLTLSLAARGLTGPGQRTRWRDLRMRPTDWAWAFFMTVGFVTCIWLRINGFLQLKMP
jgi:energy-coupling factor transport system permease protein